MADRRKTVIASSWVSAKMIRIFFILIVALGVAGLSLSNAISLVAENQNPPLAARMVPENGLVLSEVASLSLRVAAIENDGQPPEVFPEGISDLAMRGYMLEPTDPEPIRLMALAAENEGNLERARELMRLVPAMSRRDKVANLWLMQDYGRLESFPEVLAVFDWTLRASSSAREQFIPLMATALSDERLVQPFAELMDGRPEWSPQFWRSLIGSDGSLQNAGKLRQLTAKRGYDLPEGQDERLLQRLIAKGYLEEAFDLHGILSNKTRVETTIINGDFAESAGLPPFDWQLISTGYLGASIQPSSRKLFISAIPESSGIVARQLFRAAPGAYSLSVKLATKPTTDTDLGVIIRCAEKPVQQPKSFRVEGSTLTSTVDLSASCTYYWLEIAIAVPGKGVPSDVAIEQIDLSRL